MEDVICPGAEHGSEFVFDPGSLADPSKRRFLQAAGMLMAGLLVPRAGAAESTRNAAGSGHKVVVVVIGGVRRDETFSPEGLVNIPHLSADLLPRSLFYLHARNEGVTAHFNAISSILTGNWQRVDDWGKLAPTTPTLFEQFRKGLGVDRSDTWVVASNKALTSLIGASSDTNYGPAYGANVVFPKQLMLTAVVDALRNGRTANMADRSKVEAELESAMAGSNYEGLGWNVFDASDQLDPRVRATIQNAIAEFVRSGGPTSGDELTFFMTREIMRKFAPQVLVVAFSDVEAAHFGSYSTAHVGYQDCRSPYLSTVAGDRGQSGLQGTDHDGSPARIRTRSRWIVDQRIFQSSRQHRIDARHLDDGPGRGRGQAANG